MRGFALVLPLVLAACLPGQRPEVVHRNPDAPISSSTRFDLGRFGGEWVIRAAFPGDEDWVAVNFTKDFNGEDALEVAEKTCEDPPASECEISSTFWDLRVIGPGRMAISEANGGDRELWVMWVDDGFRTAAIGTPDGSFGWILDREGRGGVDRYVAATEVMAFNGYNLSRLVERAPQ